MQPLILAHSFLTLMEEDPDPVPLDAIEELRQALTAVRWKNLAEHASGRVLMRRLDVLKRAAQRAKWEGVPV